MSLAATEIERISWDAFQGRFDWRQGQHLTLIGPTGSGKSTLAESLLESATHTHPWQCVFATKRRDPVIDTFQRKGYVRLPEWIVTDPELYPHVILAPPLKRASASETQREAFLHALNSIFRQGGWLVYLDELRHITSYLGLEAEVELLLHQGRSLGVTVVGGVQRPRHVPLLAYDQATHLFFWPTRDRTMVKRLSEIGGMVDPDTVVRGLDLINSHEFLYVNPVTGDVVISEVKL